MSLLDNLRKHGKLTNTTHDWDIWIWVIRYSIPLGVLIYLIKRGGVL